MFLTMMASTFPSSTSTSIAIKLGLWNDAISNTIGLGKLVLLDVVQQQGLLEKETYFVYCSLFPNVWLDKVFVRGRLKKNPGYSNIFGPLLSAPPKSAGVPKYPWCSEAYRCRNHLADIGMCIGY